MNITSKGLLLFVIVLIFTLAAVGCTANEKAPPAKTAISQQELDPAAWGKIYPLQYDSYLKNNDESKTPFGGSVKESKFVTEPEIKELFKGYGFGKDYNEDRGHTFALQDLLATKRVNEKTPGSCLTCKSASVPGLIKEMGPAYYTAPILETAKKVKHPVSCSDCHDSETMKLTITRPAFTAGMKARGIDVSKASKQEMRSYVCAQCHVEYYFKKNDKLVVFPWDNGMEPEQIEKYYNTMSYSDWEHPDSKAKLLKVQHPEFESWRSGVHGTAQVSCADCHMPYMTRKGQKYSSHWWTSPLKTVEVSCQTCHKQDAQWLKDRVLNTQEKTFNLQTKASKLISEAHQAISKASASSAANTDKLEKAREMTVKAQWYWDWVAAENSRGFHNPVQALDCLAQAIDYAHQAKDLAEEVQ